MAGEGFWKKFCCSEAAVGLEQVLLLLLLLFTLLIPDVRSSVKEAF